jgi:hypothetical protein
LGSLGVEFVENGEASSGNMLNFVGVLWDTVDWSWCWFNVFVVLGGWGIIVGWCRVVSWA